MSETMSEAKSLRERKLLTEHDICDLTGMSIATVRRWRLFGRGPRFLKLGASVRYRTEDLDLWLDRLPGGGTHPSEAQ